MNMDIKKIVDYLRMHYDVTRQSGHTTALMEGANNVSNPMIIAVDKNHMTFLKDLCKNKSGSVIMLEDCDSYLRGRKSPILFDNYTLYTIFREVSKEFDRLYTLLDHQEYWEEDRSFIKRVDEIFEREGRKEADEKLEKIKEIVND